MGSFFSVIIPLYNKADTILRTLASVEAQTFRDFEVIIIDDGSKDKGVAVIQNSQFANQCRITSQPNKGVSAARNAGVAQANGDYLCFLDADDEWFPHYLQRMSELIKKFPGAGIYGAGFTRPGYKLKKGFRRDGYCDIFDEATVKMPFNTDGLIIPKDIFMSFGGFDEIVSYYEDYQLIFQIALKYDVVVTREILTIYNFDAKESANGKVRDFSISLFPHFFVVEKSLQDGERRQSVRRYACWQMRSMLSYSILRGKRGDEEKVRQAFLCMCQCVPEQRLYRKNMIGTIFCFFISKYIGLRFRLAILGLV